MQIRKVFCRKNALCYNGRTGIKPKKYEHSKSVTFMLWEQSFDGNKRKVGNRELYVVRGIITYWEV